jgi:Na+-translocating ferredoxin:NAD+ oxidoreductase RnfD subunit
MSDPAKPPRKREPVSGRILTIWFAMMSVAGALFGISSEGRPFGDDVLEHPLVIMFIVVGAALLAIRFALRRPVSEVIPDRLLVFGCIVGLVAFLLGNWFAVHLRVL